MGTKVTVKRTIRRKDGNAKATVSKRTSVNVGKGTATVSRSRSISSPGKENVRVSKKG